MKVAKHPDFMAMIYAISYTKEVIPDQWFDMWRTMKWDPTRKLKVLQQALDLLEGEP